MPQCLQYIAPLVLELSWLQWMHCTKNQVMGMNIKHVMAGMLASCQTCLHALQCVLVVARVNMT